MIMLYPFSFDGLQLFPLLCSTLMGKPGCHGQRHLPQRIPATVRPTNSEALSRRLLVSPLERSIVQADHDEPPHLRAQQVHREAPSPYPSCACTAPRQPFLGVTGDTDAPLVSPVFEFSKPAKPRCCFAISAAPPHCVCKVHRHFSRPHPFAGINII
ncbi:hypothetical protein BT93_B2257 [Corymbia citriodora subsp. variegata]|nr:hypothetical protein BT93_B2257 [Corymbia citriodora subsp. variegata]